MILTPQQPPPEDYYQNNCRVMFAFVLQHYRQILDKLTISKLTGFIDLQDQPQRLFARLLTRKGPLIRLDKIDYREVDDLRACLDALSQSGLIHMNQPTSGDDMLRLFVKAELLEMFAFPQTSPSTMRKSDLVLSIYGRYTDQQIAWRCLARSEWLTVADAHCWNLTRLLYFGNARHDWSAFVIRDLGMVRYERVNVRQARFASASALSCELRMRSLSQFSYRLDDHPELAPELIERLQHDETNGMRHDPQLEHRRQRVLLHIGQWLERRADVDQAVAVYRLCDQHPARERMVRMLSKAGQDEAAQALLKQIRDAPRCDEEAQFAQRFGKRRAGYQPPVTQIEIQAVRTDVEQQALELLTADGGWGAHVENSLFKTLTGLLYWDAVFADVDGAFFNPFQSGPSDLFGDQFCDSRQAWLDQIESATAADEALYDHLRQVAQEKHGIANTLVNWSLLEQIGLQRLLDCIPAAHIRRICAFIIRHLGTHRKGMPDLLLVNPQGDYELIEVKGPTDQLQPAQRVWFRLFRELRIPARVVKLKLAAA